jgi:diguanylate cyclase (GGDEF)-like protein/PAS domain S-box-containing protein
MTRTVCKDNADDYEIMRLFIAHAPSAIAMFDCNMHYLAASRRWIEDYGLQGRDIIGQSHYEVFPEISEAWKRVHYRALLGETVTAREDRFDRIDGNTQWLNWEVRPWHTATNEIGGIVIFAEDITYLRETEQALKRKIQELEKLMDAVPAAVWIANDPECRLVTGNAVANQIFEASKDENVSPTTIPEARRIFAQDGRELRPEELPMQLAAAANREIRNTELRIEIPSGKSITILGNAAPLRDEHGNSIGSIAAFQDISQRKQAEIRVQESERRFKSLFDNMLNGIAHCRMLFEDGVPVDFVYLDVNKAFEKQTGLRNVVGKKVSEVIPGIREQSPELFERYGRVAKGYGPEHFEIYVEPLKEWFSLSVYGGEPDHFVAAFDVITEQKKADVNLRIAAKAFESLNGIMVTDANRTILRVNQSFTEITGYAAEEIIGKTSTILKSGHQERSFYEAMWEEIRATGSWMGEIWDRRKDGTLFDALLSIRAVHDQSGGVINYVSSFVDLSQLKKAKADLEHVALYDQLTDLPNRRLFRVRLEQDAKRIFHNNSSLALLIIDLDKFKEVNDTLGHDKGDILLIEAAKRIQQHVRDTDTFARLGGDEFAIILPDYEDRSNIDRVVQNVLEALEEPFHLGDENMGHISGSIGIALYPEEAENIDELLRHADQAMYAAKQSGRNGFSYFTPSMQEEAHEKLSLTNDLRHALKNRELEVYYQPIVELSSGKIEKAEALLRWHHPVRGMVSPVVFIPLAEESGLILEIGEWVFEETLRNITGWQARTGKLVQVSVNKSPIQFLRAEIHPWLETYLKSGLPRNTITVEITEGLLLSDSGMVRKEFSKFREHGVELSIDDFGTGFSALSYLNRFDVDYLKIDKSFVQKIETADSASRALTEAIIIMAHKLNIKTVAEGVETTEQRDILKSFGCDYVQGFLYSEPVPAQAFEKLIAEQNMLR